MVRVSDGPESRLAVAVTTKIDKRAVVRNKIKRRIREVFRTIRADLLRPIDVVVIARRDAQICELNDYRREIVGALRAKGFLGARENC
jgi:ribonuclease P protein component